MLRPTLVLTSIVLLIGTGACGDSAPTSPYGGDGDDESGQAEDEGDGDDEDGDGDGEDHGDGDDDATDDDGDDTGMGKFDVGAMPDVPPPEPVGCEKVDLLFIVDDSGSMADNQTNLVSSFPGFVDSMEEKLGNVESYHVGVVTTDEYIFNAQGCAKHGALVTQTGGQDASNQVCTPFASGKRFMTQDDDLDSAFACAAKVGDSGYKAEKPMLAMQEALGDLMAGPGQCNEGFKRDDALLVIVMITDEEDDNVGPQEFNKNGSPGDPDIWFENVVATQEGIEENIVVLSLVTPPQPNACPDNVNNWPTLFLGTRLTQFTEMFTYGFVGDVCAPNYGQFFDDAISVVEAACLGYEPPA